MTSTRSHGSLLRSDQFFSGFSWHAPPSTFDVGKQIIEAHRSSKPRQCVADLPRLEYHPGAIYLPWKKPARYISGYGWFTRLFEDLETANKDEKVTWKVVGHAGGYDPAEIPNSGSQRRGDLADGASEAERPGRQEPKPLQAKAEKPSTSERARDQPPQGQVEPEPPAQEVEEASRLDATGCCTDAAVREASRLGLQSPPLPLILARGWRALVERGTGWAVGQPLGEGTFGAVRACRAAGGAAVAMKTLKKKVGEPDRHLQQALVEVVIADVCRGQPHIIQMLDIFCLDRLADPKRAVSFAYELALRDLHQDLKVRGGRLPPGGCRAMVEQVASGLGFLHSRALLHGDVKPANILMFRAPPNPAASSQHEPGGEQLLPEVSCSQQAWFFKLADLGSATEAKPPNIN